MSMIGRHQWDDDPRVAAIVEEYEAWYRTPDGQAVDAARGREEWLAIPEEVREHVGELSRRLHEARMLVRAERAMRAHP